MEHLRKQYPQLRFAHSQYFGFEPEVFALLDERVNKWLRGAPHATVRYDVAGHVPHSHDHHGHAHVGHGHDHSHDGHHHAHDHDHTHIGTHAHAHGGTPADACSHAAATARQHDHADDGNDAVRHCTHVSHH